MQTGSLTTEGSLTELADRFGSDKGTRRGDRHRYTYLYDALFGGVRHDDLVMLEIGLAVGGPENLGVSADRAVAFSPSVSMWLQYFERATIYGFDISDFSAIHDPRFIFMRGDAGSAQDLDRLAAATPLFDIIIDDGSHASYHQQITLKTLWPRLAPGGLYIIEDLHWQPQHYERSLPGVPKTAKFLSDYFERSHYLENRVLSQKDMHFLRSQAMSAAFFPSFDTSFRPRKFVWSFLQPKSSATKPWTTKMCVIRKRTVT